MFMLIPISLLLTLSFFVRVTMNKLTDRPLKIFGWAVCILLWLSAAVIAVSACMFCSSQPYGGYGQKYGYGRLKGICPLPAARSSQADPYHPWRNQPDPHHGFMMEESDDPFTGLADDLKCPVAEGNAPIREPEASADTKK